MQDLTILTITSDGDFLAIFRRQLHDQLGSSSPMIVADTIDEACSLLKTTFPRLIVVHWTGDSGRYEQLDRLLWTTTVQARRVPIVVIVERYRTYQATMMYRLGVSEYISRTHHLNQLGPVLSAYLPLRMPAAPALTAVEDIQQGKAWSSNQKALSVASQAV